MDLISYSVIPLAVPLLAHLRRLRPHWLFGLAGLTHAAFGVLSWLWHMQFGAQPITSGVEASYIVPPAYVGAPTLAVLMGALFALFAVQTRLRGVFAGRSLIALFWALNISALAGSLAPRWIAAVAPADAGQNVLLWMNTAAFAAAQIAWLCLIGLLVILALSALRPKPTRT